MSIKETSEITGISQNTIKTLTRNERESNQTINGADVDEKIEEVGKDNERIIDSKSRRITTLEGLIKFCKIDLNEWTIDRHVINKWEVGVNGGDGIEVSPLFQVKAWLSKKHPEAIKPVIQPVQINVEIPKAAKPTKSKFKKALLMGDAQIGFTRSMRTGKLTPFHDRLALGVSLALLKVHKFDQVIIGGDWLDFSMWSSKFLKKPSFYFTTQPALIECAWLLTTIRKLQPDAEILYIEGNHEIRPEVAIMDHFVDGYGLRSADNIDGQAVMSIPNLLGLPKIGVEYIGNYPAGESWLNDRAVIRHGNTARKGSGATVSAIAKEALDTEIVFHIHRMEMVGKTIHAKDGTKIIYQFCPGCLCRIDGAVPGDERPNWQQGIAVVSYDNKQYVNIEPIPIHEGQALYRDQVFTGTDYTQQLRKDTCFTDKAGEKSE